jgi:hypothetical protein
MGDVNPKPEKSPSPDTAKIVPQASESLSPSGTKGSPGPVRTLSPMAAKKTPSTMITPNPSPANATQSPNLSESLKEKTPPSSPQSHVLGTTGGAPSQGNFNRPGTETPPQMFLWVANSLPKDLNFIKAGFHIGRFVTTAVDNEAEQAGIQALRGDLDFVSLWINVSTPFLFCITTFS